MGNIPPKDPMVIMLLQKGCPHKTYAHAIENKYNNVNFDTYEVMLLPLQLFMTNLKFNMISKENKAMASPPKLGIIDCK